ncbi:MAG TPA: aldehyde dehydrogenase family protein, partial [bacterium]|nr:aldehyde dehydrogenase family protein [bacterium]
MTYFQNMPFLDFSQKANRDWIAGTLMSVRSQLPFRVPVVVNGKEVSGLETRQVTNPSLSKEVVSINAMATRKEADEALSACESAKQTWGKWPVGKRVHVLRKAADLMEKYRKELTTIMVLEEAKS